MICINKVYFGGGFIYSLKWKVDCLVAWSVGWSLSHFVGCLVDPRGSTELHFEGLGMDADYSWSTLFLPNYYLYDDFKYDLRVQRMFSVLRKGKLSTCKELRYIPDKLRLDLEL